MSTVQFFALLLCGFCLAALLIGLIRPSWVLPLRRATRVKVLLLYSAAGVMVLFVAGELPDRSAHAEITDSQAASATAPLAGSAPAADRAPRLAAGAADPDRSPGQPSLFEQEPEPESLRALASRVLLDLGFGSGHRLRTGRLTVVYEDPVTPEQAAALGEFLSRSEIGAVPGAGSDLGGATGHRPGPNQDQVQVHLRLVGRNSPGGGPAGYELRIATPFSHRQQLDAEIKATYQLVGLIVSGLAFDGAPVFVHICTPLLRPLVVLRPQLG